MLAITTALKKISRQLRKPDKRIYIVQGGMRAGKTYAILLLIIDYALKRKGQRIGIFSHSYPHLRRGVIYDFVRIMRELERYDENKFNKSSNIYTFPTGTTIEFITTDNVASLHGTQFDIAFVNEAIYVDRESFNRIMFTSKKLIVDYNPTRKFYVHDLIGRDDVTFQKLTYIHNELCPDVVVNELERIKQLASTNTYWANYYRIYGEGEIGNSIDSVYPDWKYVNFLPVNAELKSLGVDFGFTNDVTAIVAIYYADGIYYLNEVAYETGLTTAKIADYIKDFPCPIYADNAEPRLIAELKQLLHRQNIYGVKYKRHESIDYLKSLEICVLITSKNIMNEHQNYMYIRDKYTGELTNEPVGTNDHAMDAIRYGIVGLHENSNRGKYVTTF